MALFRRRRREGEETVGRGVVVTDHLGDEVLDEDELEAVDELDPVQEAEAVVETDAPPPTPREETGPFDRSEVEHLDGRFDLGSVWLSPVPGMELRIEIEESDGTVRAITAAIGDSAMQMQAFAAPRSSGIWRPIRQEIADSVRAQGGSAEEADGPLGTELITRLPSAGSGGRTVFHVMRFIGVDGPRWFLRSVLTGPAASDEDAAAPFLDAIRNSVIVRGQEARPPREMLPFTLPKVLTDPDPVEDPQRIRTTDDLKPFERGPEITEIH